MDSGYGHALALPWYRSFRNNREEGLRLNTLWFFENRVYVGADGLSMKNPDN
jgi:hypothetical protein